MGRTKGTQNKKSCLPAVYELSPADRMQMLTSLIVEIISEELCTES